MNPNLNCPDVKGVNAGTHSHTGAGFIPSLAFGSWVNADKNNRNWLVDAFNNNQRLYLKIQTYRTSTAMSNIPNIQEEIQCVENRNFYPAN